MSGDNYLNLNNLNNIPGITSSVPVASVVAVNDSDASIMEGSSVPVVNHVLSSSNLKEDEIELIKKELERKIQKQKTDLENAKATRGWMTSAWNGFKGCFGCGDKKIEDSIANQEMLLASLDLDTSNIGVIYKIIMGTDLDTNALSQLKNSEVAASQIDDETQETIVAELEKQVAQLEAEFETAQNSNGWISGAWNAFKNWTGIGASSNKTSAEIAYLKEQIAKFKNGEADLATTYKNITGKDLTYDELNSFLNGEEGTGLSSVSIAGQSVSAYSEGQKMCVDVVADIGSGIAAVGAVAFGTAIGVCAAPFTGGASLALVGSSFLIAGGVGAAVKTIIKGSDCIGNEKTYSLRDFGYDLITGALNGAAAPLTNALGGAAGTGVMKLCGQEALETTVRSSALSAARSLGKEIAEEGVEQAGKRVVPGLLSKGLSFVCNSAVDGSLSGFVDSSSRALAEGRYEDILSDGTKGFVGGVVFSPLIGGGFNLLGRFGTQMGKTSLGQSMGRALREGAQAFGGAIDNVLPNGVRRVIQETSESLNDKFIQTSLKNCLSISDDGIYSVKINGYSVQLLEDELSDEILEAIAKGDNTLVFVYANEVLAQELNKTVADEVADELSDMDFDDALGGVLSDDLEPEKIYKLLSEVSGENKEMAIEIYEQIKQMSGSSRMNINAKLKLVNMAIKDLNEQNVGYDVKNLISLMEKINYEYFNVIQASANGTKEAYSVALFFSTLIDTGKITEQELFDLDGEAFNFKYFLSDILDKRNKEFLMDILSRYNIDENLYFNSLEQLSSSGRMDAIVTSNNFSQSANNLRTSFELSFDAMKLIAHMEVENRDFLDLLDAKASELSASSIEFLLKNVDEVLNHKYYTPEEYIDTFVYFKNLTTADGTKIFDDSLYASLGYSLRDTFFEKNIKYLMNIDPASVKASDFQLLIESVQNGEMPTTALRLLTSSAEINPDLQSDLSMLCEVIVKNKNKETLSAELLDAYIPVVQSQSSIMPNIKIGDAFLVEGEECVRIKTSDMTSELTDITRETYYKLFPPLERFSATQMNLNNCYLIEPIMLLYSQPNTRFNIVKMFSENLQTGEITVKLNDLVDGITFPPQFVGNKNFSNGLIASQMIQEVYGQSIETNAIQTTSLPKGIYFRNQKIVGNTSSEVNVGNTGYFDDVFNNFGIFDISFVEPKSNNELEKILATIENNKKFAMCAISGHAYGLVCENGKYYLYNPYCQAMPEVFESIEEFIKKHSLETITHIYL